MQIVAAIKDGSEIGRNGVLSELILEIGAAAGQLPDCNGIEQKHIWIDGLRRLAYAKQRHDRYIPIIITLHTSPR